MEKSALQIARASYQPKLPKALRGALEVVEGEATQSVATRKKFRSCSLTHTECHTSSSSQEMAR